MKNRSSKAPNRFSNEEGKIRRLNSTEPRPANMSAVAGERMDQLGIETMVRIYTGMSPEEVSDFKSTLAIEWIGAQIETKDNQQFVEGDVYELLKNSLVRGWWKNEWMKRDREIIQDIATVYREVMEEEEGEIAYKRAIVRHRMKAKYESLHLLCLLPKTPDYKTLENSYAILWKLIR